MVEFDVLGSLGLICCLHYSEEIVPTPYDKHGCQEPRLDYDFQRILTEISAHSALALAEKCNETDL